MGEKISKEAYQKIYRLLDDATPLKGDCGELCRKLCCQKDNEDLGIYLLPGEEALFTRDEDWLVWEEQKAEDYDFPPSWQGKVYFIRCLKDCPREKRPLQCRTFPLAPHLTAKGTLVLIRETLPLPYQCPLIAEQMPLEPAFIQAVYEAWSELIKDPLIRDLVAYDSANRELPLDVVYPIPKVFS